jgi:hypothetical protein
MNQCFEITELKKYVLSSCQNSKVIQMTKREELYKIHNTKQQSMT